MDKSEELYKATLEELSSISERLNAIASVEQTFDARLEELSERVDALFAKRDALLDDLEKVHAVVNDLAAAIEKGEALQRRIDELNDRIASINIQGLADKLDEASASVGKATSKLLTAEKRSKEAEKKAKLPKK